VPPPPSGLPPVPSLAPFLGLLEKKPSPETPHFFQNAHFELFPLLKSHSDLGDHRPPQIGCKKAPADPFLPRRPWELNSEPPPPQMQHNPYSLSLSP